MQPETNISDSLIKKVQALMRLQESAHAIGSIAEAANAASKIRDLLMKHNLELHQVQDNGKTQEEEIGRTVMDTAHFTKPHEGGWVRNLADVIAEANLCRVVGTGKAIGKIYVLGSKTNAEVVWYTVEQLINRLRPMAKTAFSAYRGGEKRNTFIRGYYLGAVNGIYSQLKEAERAQKKEAEAANTVAEEFRIPQATQALQLMNMIKYEQDRVNDFINSKFGKLKSKAGSRSSSQSGRAQGFKDGNSMQIHGGVTPGAQRSKSRLID